MKKYLTVSHLCIQSDPYSFQLTIIKCNEWRNLGFDSPLHRTLKDNGFTWVDFEQEGFVEHWILAGSDLGLVSDFLGGQEEEADLGIAGPAPLLARNVARIVDRHLQGRKHNSINQAKNHTVNLHTIDF
jgi:hypothetical protein